MRWWVSTKKDPKKELRVDWAKSRHGGIIDNTSMDMVKTRSQKRRSLQNQESRPHTCHKIRPMPYASYGLT
jgi:hypothetical protein